MRSLFRQLGLRKVMSPKSLIGTGGVVFFGNRNLGIVLFLSRVILWLYTAWRDRGEE